MLWAELTNHNGFNGQVGVGGLRRYLPVFIRQAHLPIPTSDSHSPFPIVPGPVLTI